jgi:hypothetical protein
VPWYREEEWEYLGYKTPEPGETYCSLWAPIRQEDNPSSCNYLYHCFRRRADKHAWKKGIKWPSVFKEGWVARNPSRDVYWFKERPFLEIGGWDGYVVSRLDIPFTLSFFPPEFLSCDWKDSLVQVRHGGEG